MVPSEILRWRVQSDCTILHHFWEQRDPVLVESVQIHLGTTCCVTILRKKAVVKPPNPPVHHWFQLELFDSNCVICKLWCTFNKAMNIHQSSSSQWVPCLPRCPSSHAAVESVWWPSWTLRWARPCQQKFRCPVRLTTQEKGRSPTELGDRQPKGYGNLNGERVEPHLGNMCACRHRSFAAFLESNHRSWL